MKAPPVGRAHNLKQDSMWISNTQETLQEIWITFPLAWKGRSMRFGVKKKVSILGVLIVKLHLFFVVFLQLMG